MSRWPSSPTTAPPASTPDPAGAPGPAGVPGGPGGRPGRVTRVRGSFRRSAPPRSTPGPPRCRRPGSPPSPRTRARPRWRSSPTAAPPASTGVRHRAGPAGLLECPGGRPGPRRGRGGPSAAATAPSASKADPPARRAGGRARSPGAGGRAVRRLRGPDESKWRSSPTTAPRASTPDPAGAPGPAGVPGGPGGRPGRVTRVRGSFRRSAPPRSTPGPPRCRRPGSPPSPRTRARPRWRSSPTAAPPASTGVRHRAGPAGLLECPGGRPGPRRGRGGPSAAATAPSASKADPPARRAGGRARSPGAGGRAVRRLRGPDESKWRCSPATAPTPFDA